MAQRRSGCLPLILGLILVAVWIGREESDLPPLQTEAFDPRSPRRPLPQFERETYVIQDRDGPVRDSMGTAFAVDSDGVWLTAQHVTHGCARFGLEDGRMAVPVSRLMESREADVALIRDGRPSAAILPLTAQAPEPGGIGYHMGFPAGEPMVVRSELIGAADARRGMADSAEPVLVWAERSRQPERDGTLSGISGGPTLDADGHVVGVNSASTDRRGRVLTADPAAVMRLVDASRAVDERSEARPITGLSDADRQFRQWLASGVIRRAFCDVDD